MTAGSVHHEAREEHEGSSVGSRRLSFSKPWKHGKNARRVGRAAISAAALGNPFPPSLAAALQKKSVPAPLFQTLARRWPLGEDPPQPALRGCDVSRFGHTNPKRQRGTPFVRFLPSLALRVRVAHFLRRTILATLAAENMRAPCAEVAVGPAVPAGCRVRVPATFRPAQPALPES